MQNPELKKFVTDLLEEKNLVGVDQEVKNELIAELTGKLEEQIQRAVLEHLNDEQFSQFEALLDSEDTNEIASFLSEQKVPVQEITLQTLAKFRMAYLGS